MVVILVWEITEEHSLFMLPNAIASVRVLHQLLLHLLELKFRCKFMNVGCVVVAGLYLTDTEVRVL
jgi:hypothetical protein